MKAKASYWLRHVRLLPLKTLNRIQRNFTGIKITTSCTECVFFGLSGIQWNLRRQDLSLFLPSLSFSGRLEKLDGHPYLWLAETFWNFPLKTMNRIQRNFTEIKITASSTKYIFSGRTEKEDGGPVSDLLRHCILLLLNADLKALYRLFRGWPIAKIRWPPRPLIWCDIFDFSFETTERNFTKLVRRRDVSVLYQFCIFRADRKNKMATPGLDLLRHYDFSSEIAEWNSTKFDWKQGHYVLQS